MALWNFDKVQAEVSEWLYVNRGADHEKDECFTQRRIVELFRDRIFKVETIHCASVSSQRSLVVNDSVLIQFDC